MAITHDALDLTVQTSPLCTGPCPLLVISGGQDWIPVQTCSLGDLTVQAPPPHSPTGADIWSVAMYGGRTGGTHPTGMLSCCC